jgi:NADH:ubiquinone oxidoreductase subunit F (NADH-binding)
MMAEEYRVVLKNYGKISPGNIDDYIGAGGYEAFRKALKMEPEDVIDELIESGLRGRGGAGFSTGLKERFTSQACLKCENRYVICNADEGEPGTWKDRIIMESDPHMYLEGLLIAAWSIRATRGYVYIRGEYFKAIELAEKALADMRMKGFLGENILGSGFSFDIEIRKGGGFLSLRRRTNPARIIGRQARLSPYKASLSLQKKDYGIHPL